MDRLTPFPYSSFELCPTSILSNPARESNGDSMYFPPAPTVQYVSQSHRLFLHFLTDLYRQTAADQVRNTVTGRGVDRQLYTSGFLFSKQPSYLQPVMGH